MKEELHLFILWENSRDKQQEIIEDIKQNFELVEMIEIEWSKEHFINNISRFYGTNLPNAEGKVSHCGNGKFLLIIVKDLNPIYEQRTTSKGLKIVNSKMFDKKEQYRNLTGGGHKIHGTNNEQETNHDLTLLLEKNINDYLENLDKNTNNTIKQIKLDLFRIFRLEKC